MMNLPDLPRKIYSHYRTSDSRVHNADCAAVRYEEDAEMTRAPVVATVGDSLKFRGVK